MTASITVGSSPVHGLPPLTNHHHHDEDEDESIEAIHHVTPPTYPTWPPASEGIEGMHLQELMPPPEVPAITLL